MLRIEPGSFQIRRRIGNQRSPEVWVHADGYNLSNTILFFGIVKYVKLAWGMEKMSVKGETRRDRDSEFAVYRQTFHIEADVYGVST